MELKFNSNFLNHILLQAIMDTEFLQRIRTVVDVNTYKTKERKYIAELVYSYFDEYRKAPQDHFYDIFQKEKKKISNGLFEKCIDLIGNIKAINHSNPEYLLSHIKQAVKHFRLEEASVGFAQLVKAEKYDEAENLILKALKDPEDIQESCFDFFADISYIENRVSGKNYKMKSLVPGLDPLIGGFNPTWLVTILGTGKSGKTSWLVELAVAALVQGLKVLFITLEMSRSEIIDKFDQCIGFMTNSETEVLETMVFKNNQWIKIKKKLPSIYNLKKVKNARKALKKLGGDLIIDDVSSGKLNYKGVETVLDFQELNYGRLFDIIIVDYLGCMSPVDKGQNKKERIADNTLGLKQLAKKRNIIVVTAQQGNRKAMESKTFHSSMIADAIEPIFDSDLVLAICQTPQEEKNNVSRIYVAEHRHGKKHQEVSLVRDLSIGQIGLGIATPNLLTKEDSKDEKEMEDEY